MSEKKLVRFIWAAVIALLIGSMALAGMLARQRPEYVVRPALETCAAHETAVTDGLGS